MRIAILVLVLATATARAETPSEPVSEDAALWWSAGGTLAAGAVLGAGAIIMATTNSGAAGGYGPQPSTTAHTVGNALAVAGGIGVFVAPSYGHVRVHDYWTLGVGLRLTGAIAMALAEPLATCVDPADFDCAKNSSPTGMYILGGILVGAGALVDLVQTRDAVRAYNKQHATLSLAPMVGSHYGLALAGSF